MIRKDDNLKSIAMNLFNSMPLPLIFKPVAMGSSHGVIAAFNFNELEEALVYAFSFSDELFKEKGLSFEYT